MTTTLRQETVAHRAEPALALARQLLCANDASGAHHALCAALATYHIVGPVAPEPQSIADALKPLARQIEAAAADAPPTFDRVQLNTIGDAACKMDTDAVIATIRTAIENAALSGDAVLLVNVDAEAEPPMIELIFEGPGSFPDVWFVGGIAPIAFDELRLQWTRHTAGGRLDRTPNGVTFKLVGQREPQPNPAAEEGVRAAIVDAERALRMAVADGKPPDAAPIQRALDAIDAPSKREPADIGALLRNMQDERPGIALKVSEGVPPIAVHRDRLAVSLRRLCELALPRIAAGARAEMVTHYNAPNLAIEIEANFPRDDQDTAWHAALAAIERVVEDLHDGAALTDLNNEACFISLSIPDTIGAAVDAWIPGAAAFADRSIQMLRLLKSGGQAPPEDIILPGVLEAELERWLMAALAAAPAVNVAHDLEKGSKGSPRLEKAIGQIRRGKPKKEICAPPYAAEILRAYAVDERGRNALGLDALPQEEIKSLQDALASEPPGYLACLRLLAKITRAVSA